MTPDTKLSPEEALKPCAHCGGKAAIYQEVVNQGGQHHNGPLAFYIYCTECLIATDHVGSRSQLRHKLAWNARINSDGYERGKREAEQKIILLLELRSDIPPRVIDMLKQIIFGGSDAL